MQKKRPGFAFYFFLLLFSVLFLAVLELNKNSLSGFGLFAALLLLFLLIRVKWPRPRWYGCLFLWILFFAGFAGILIYTWPKAQRLPAVSAEEMEITSVYSVKDGDLTGVWNEEGTVEVFAGIPYAAPPVGDLRFREPEDPAPWSGVLKADTFAPMSMQPRNLPIYDSLSQIIGYHDYEFSLSDNYTEAVSEDSLYLNIWKPAGDVSDLPVLVFIHGGSLQTGQPSYGDYNGETLAEEGVIVVNMGYRLGIFGFYADEELAAESPNGTTGNYGLLDQIKALTWVQENISAFGGDPSNVTLAGESAGAACVSALCTSPLAKGLFRRAILESSALASKEPPHSFRLLEDAFASGKELKARLGVSSVADLRAMSAEELVQEAATQHHITVDGYALTETPYESYRKGIHNEEAILHGYNADESAPFLIFDKTDLSDYEGKVRAYFGDYADDVLALFPASDDETAKEAWADIYSVIFFEYSHYALNRAAASCGVPVYEYYFTKANGRLSAWHSGEMIYAYGNIPEDSDLFTDEDRELSRMMVRYIRNFAVYGDPNGDPEGEAAKGIEDPFRGTLPAFEENASGRSIMELGDHVGMTKEPYLPFYEVFDRMQGWDL